MNQERHLHGCLAKENFTVLVLAWADTVEENLQTLKSVANGLSHIKRLKFKLIGLYFI